MKRVSLSQQINKRIIFVALVLVIVSVIFAKYQLSKAEHSVFKQMSQVLQADIKTKEVAKRDAGIVGAVAVASNPMIVESLVKNDRAMAIEELRRLMVQYKDGTSFKNVKFHLHTADLHSFLRAWKPKKFGDDLSSSRNTILKVKSTKQPLGAIEVGRAGLVVRGLSPIFDVNHKYIGSVEMIQGFNSIVKSLKNEKTDLLVLVDENYKRGSALGSNMQLQNYYISQKVVDDDFRDAVNKLDLKQLQKDGFLTDGVYLYTTTSIKDVSGNTVGIYVLGKRLSDINGFISEVDSLVYSMLAIIILIVISAIVIIHITVKSIILKELDKFRKQFFVFLDFTQFKTNRYTPAKIEQSNEISDLIELLNKTGMDITTTLQNDMKVMGEIVLVSDKVEQGIYRCKIKATSNNPMIMTLKNTVNNMIDAMNRDMSQLRDVVAQYTHDDFRNKVNISPALKEDMLAVMESVNTLGEALANSAKANLTNGQHLQSNSATMTQSVDNLAAKANQQAASLEETAAALEEITSITRNNASNATKMSELGGIVNKAVENGSSLASQTSNAMDEINEQVQSINEAISVIDQIAFQTNILSLNAAVEAATAGEAGKGFAVVAQEVRNLASRSAEAANEIKAIVENASSKTADGKHISENMLKGYEAISEHFSQTIHLIEDVSAASKEQMTGIEQINDAVTMLDRVTQENASEANSVAQIAADVSNMADELVADASSKKF